MCNNNKFYAFEYIFAISIVLLYIGFVCLVIVDDSLRTELEFEDTEVMIVSDYLSYAVTTAAFLLTYISLFLNRKQINRLLLLSLRRNLGDFEDVSVAIVLTINACSDMLFYLVLKHPTILFVIYNFSSYVYLILLSVINRIVAGIKFDYRTLNSKLRSIKFSGLEETAEIVKDKQCLEQTLETLNNSFQLPVLSLLCVNIILITLDIFYLVSELLTISAMDIFIINTCYYTCNRLFQVYSLINMWSSFKCEVSNS